MKRAFAHLRDRLIRGILLVLPMVITVWLLRLLFLSISDNVTPLVLQALGALGFIDPTEWHARIVAPMVGLVLTFLLVYLLGSIAANLVGRRLLRWIESGILRIPIVKSIYGASRQLLDAISLTGSGSFSRVVLLEYPRRGLWTLGFVTNEERQPIDARAGGGSGPTLLVFLPTTPNPTSGWLVIVDASEVRELDLTVEQGIKIIVSGGIVTPGSLVSKLRAPAPS